VLSSDADMNYEYESNLNAYPILVKELDITYGGPDFKVHVRNPRIPKGRSRLNQILSHLAKQKFSTCEEIAKEEYDRNVTGKVKLKSITDDIRKFMNDKLIPKRLVLQKGTIQKRNKKIKTYSLTPFGILYFIHLGSADIEHVAKKYKEELPFVFGRFNVFKDILGKNFIKKIGIKHLSDFGLLRSKRFLDIDYILNDFIQFSSGAWVQGIAGMVMSHNNWYNQLSYAVYNNILMELVIDNIVTKDSTKMQKQWLQIINSDSKIEKWFKEFSSDALRANQAKVKQLKLLNNFVKKKIPDLRQTYQ